jgi:hypothetical protein
VGKKARRVREHDSSLASPVELRLHATVFARCFVLCCVKARSCFSVPWFPLLPPFPWRIHGMTLFLCRCVCVSVCVCMCLHAVSKCL